VSGCARVYGDEPETEVKKVTMTELEKLVGGKFEIVEPPVHTITIDGKEVQISQESFEALKKSLG